MPLEQLVFICLFFPLAIIFTIMTFYYRSMWWWGFVSGLVWVIIGVVSITQEVAYYYQRELGVVWIVIGIGMFFSMYFAHKKQEGPAEETDIQAYKREMKEYIGELKEVQSLGMRPKPKRPRTILYGRKGRK